MKISRRESIQLSAGALASLSGLAVSQAAAQTAPAGLAETQLRNISSLAAQAGWVRAGIHAAGGRHHHGRTLAHQEPDARDRVRLSQDEDQARCARTPPSSPAR